MTLVVDLDCVLEVLSQLESFSITKEALEATRLGKHINDLRRNTKDQQLANRAKALVKKWRKLLVNPQPSGGGGAGGGGTAPPSVAPSESSGNGSRQCSPGLPTAPQGGSTLHSTTLHNSVGKTSSKTASNSPNNGSLAVINLPHISSSLPSSRSTSPGGAGLSLFHSSRPTSPESRPISPSSQGSGVSRTHQNSKNKRSKRSAGRGPHEDEPNEKRSRISQVIGSTNGSLDFQLDCDTRDSFVSNGSGGPSHLGGPTELLGGSKVLGNGNSNGSLVDGRDHKSRRSKRLGSRENNLPSNATSVIEQQMQSARKTGKVRTTQEIVQEMALRSQSPRLMSEGVASNLSATSLMMPFDGGSLAQSKDQMMNKFLASSLNGVHGGSDSGGPSTASSHAPSPDPPAELSSGNNSLGRHFLDPVDAVMAQLPVIDAAEVLASYKLSEENSSEHLDSKDDGEVDEDDDDDVDDVEIEGLIPIKREPPKPIDESFLSKLHDGHLENVNGNTDHSGEFCEWHEVLSKETMGGELLYILPYSVID
ncbi:mediator of RNA polymerase II transcription subunit 26-like isoform X2 [Tigriopus californicus]|uniref:mediator of RNA polymerase II transcription subunit 26-like isoform X2 n=1 Tax=Tigriopus californicus TaxID=6832 RepID=UPI0027D9FFB8|nr:mediator of RNA polymerase II transcription subunit 26-like isoform X2 [Tigriopus californicus]